MKKTSKYLILQQSVLVCHQQTQWIHKKIQSGQLASAQTCASLLQQQSQLLQSMYELTQSKAQLESLQRKNPTQFLLFQAGAHSMLAQSFLYQALASLTGFLQQQALFEQQKRANGTQTFEEAQQFLQHATEALQMRFDALQLLHASAVPHNMGQHAGNVDALFLLLQSTLTATHLFLQTPLDKIPLFDLQSPRASNPKEAIQNGTMDSKAPDATFWVLKLQEMSTQSLFSYLNHKSQPEEHTKSAMGKLLRQWLLFAYKSLLTHPEVSQEQKEQLLYPALEKLALSSPVLLAISPSSQEDPLLEYLSPAAHLFPTD